MIRWNKGVLLLTVIMFFIVTSVNVFADDSGLLTNIKNVPKYTDVEFNNAPVKLEIFTASWCSRCARLKSELPDILHKKYQNQQVAIRIWQIDDGSVAPHMTDMENEVNVPEAVKGSVPGIFINETYYYAGYDSDISKKLLEDIDAILHGKKVPNGGNLTGNIINKTGTNGAADNGSGAIGKELINAFNIFKNGFGDSINFLLIFLCFLSYIYFIDSEKKNKLLVAIAYFIGMFLMNIIILQGLLPEICNKSYISVFKIVFTLVIIYLLYNIGEALMNKWCYGKAKFSGITRNFLKRLEGVLNSKCGYLLAAVIGFLIMYCQVSNMNSHYMDMFTEVNMSISLLSKLSKIFCYTLGVGFPSILYGVIISMSKKLRKAGKIANVPVGKKLHNKVRILK